MPAQPVLNTTFGFGGMGFEFRIEGWQEITKGGKQAIPFGITHGLENILFGMIGILTRYPPQPIPITYIRTGNLGAGWRVEKDNRAESTYVAFNNTVEYAPDVMGPYQLPLFAKIGWKTVDQIAKENEASVKHSIEVEIQRALHRI